MPAFTADDRVLRTVEEVQVLPIGTVLVAPAQTSDSKTLVWQIESEAITPLNSERRAYDYLGHLRIGWWEADDITIHPPVSLASTIDDGGLVAGRVKHHVHIYEQFREEHHGPMITRFQRCKRDRCSALKVTNRNR